jgi:hypothetical protein
MTRKIYIFVLTFFCLLCGEMGYAGDIFGGELKEVIVNNCDPDSEWYDFCRCNPEWCDCTSPLSPDYPCEYVDNGDCTDERSYAYPCYDPCNSGSIDYDACLCDPSSCEEDTPTEPTEPPCSITSCPAGYVWDSDNCKCDPDCTNEIADKIKNVNEPVFKNIIEKFNNPNSPYKVNVFNGPIQGSGSMAQTQPTTVRGTYNIVTNENYTTETSLIATANILHEYIHAYFNTLWDDWKNNRNTHAYDDYPVLKEYYIDKTYSSIYSEDAHHEQIADSFINNISDALKELEPGSSDQYYKDMAWATLFNTPVYESDLNETEQKRIKTIRESEVTNTEREGNQPQGKPCNK